MSVAAQAPDRGRKKPSPISKQDLSAQQVRLLELMQDINFGRIEGLSVRDGEPVLDPHPRVIREVKFGGDNSARPEIDASNFLLKAQVIELFQHFDELGTGAIEVLVIKHGLPFCMSVEGTAA